MSDRQDNSSSSPEVAVDLAVALLLVNSGNRHMSGRCDSGRSDIGPIRLETASSALN